MTNDDITPAVPLRLWLVRHGRTLFNELELAQGWSDSPLTVEGVQGAERLAVELRDIPWVAAYSSSSERAMDTAEIVLGAGGQPISRDRRWKEYNFGVWEARPSAEMFSRLLELSDGDGDPGDRLKGLFRGDYPALEGGETGAAFLERVSAAVADLRATHESGDVLIVTHGMTVALAATLLDPDFEFQDGMENATFTLIELSGPESGRVLAYGAHCVEDVARLRPSSPGVLAT